MSGKRRKALRREFRKRHGRPPRLADHRHYDAVHPVMGNEFRAFKKNRRSL